ncbi:MinD/ParA family protein, partial [Aquiluna sp.]|nr:MinD/ParA family protein [Aquiluna sp.]
MSRKNDDEVSSGENADYSDLELDPETGQIVSVSAEGEQVTVASAVFEESEPASMLTADRLLRDEARPRIIPETFGKFNPGDNKKVLARRALDARIMLDLEGETRFVPVLTRKGGVGKTTITTLIGMAM